MNSSKGLVTPSETEKIKESTANIKENFQFRFRSVWT